MRHQLMRKGDQRWRPRLRRRAFGRTSCPGVIVLSAIVLLGVGVWLGSRPSELPRRVAGDSALQAPLEFPPLVVSPASSRLAEASPRRPWHFEANHGQTDGQVTFLARGPEATLFLTAAEAVLALTPRPIGGRGQGPHGPPTAPSARRGTRSLVTAAAPPARAPAIALRLTFVGANPRPAVVGLEELPGKHHFIRGSDPRQWRTDVPLYAKVAYHDIYPGVTLVYYGSQGELEYDLIVAPGADPHQITLRMEGADRIGIDPHGDLVWHTAAGTIRQRTPRVYQEVDGTQAIIPSQYILNGRNHIGFQVGAYDPSQPLEDGVTRVQSPARAGFQ